MIKSFTLLALLTLTSVADQKVKCDRCFTGKAYIKCSYYVEKQADLSKQSTCLTYADSLLKGESPGRASWYYIVGGDLDKSVEAGEKAVAQGEYFAYEFLGEAWLLKGDTNKAENYFGLLQKKAPGSSIFVQKHFDVLSRLYPKQFDRDSAEKLLR